MFPPGLQRKQPVAALGDSVQISTIFCQVLLQEQSQTALALETETEHLQRVQGLSGEQADGPSQCQESSQDDDRRAPQGV